MNTKDSWFKTFVIIVVIAVVTAFLAWYLMKNADNKEREERLKRFNALTKEKEILLNHKSKLINLENQIQVACKNYWNRVVQIYLTMLIFLLIPIAFWIFDFSFIEQTVSYYSMGHSIFTSLYFIFSLKTFSLKTIIQKKIESLAYKKVAGHRDAEYYVEKQESIDDRIEQIDLEINQLLIKA